MQPSVAVTVNVYEVGGEDRHIALIVERGMEGFEVGARYDTVGLRGNDLRHLYFRDVRVPPENVLGEPGEGFKLAMHILNNGRLSLATGSVGGAKAMLDLAIAQPQTDDAVTDARRMIVKVLKIEVLPVV